MTGLMRLKTKNHEVNVHGMTCLKHVTNLNLLVHVRMVPNPNPFIYTDSRVTRNSHIILSQ